MLIVSVGPEGLCVYNIFFLQTHCVELLWAQMKILNMSVKTLGNQKSRKITITEGILSLSTHFAKEIPLKFRVEIKQCPIFLRRGRLLGPVYTATDNF